MSTQSRRMLTVWCMIATATVAATPVREARRVELQADCEGMMERFADACGNAAVAPFRRECAVLHGVHDYRRLYFKVQTRLQNCIVL